MYSLTFYGDKRYVMNRKKFKLKENNSIIFTIYNNAIVSIKNIVIMVTLSLTTKCTLFKMANPGS